MTLSAAFSPGLEGAIVALAIAAFANVAASPVQDS